MGAWLGGQLHGADEAQDRERGGAQDTHPDTRTPAASWDLSAQDGHSGPPKPTPRSHQQPPEQRPDESETCGKGQTRSSSRGFQEPGGQGPPHPRCASESRPNRPLPHLLLLAPSDSIALGCRPGFQPETLLCEAPFTVWVLSYFVPQMQNEGLNYRLNLLLNRHMDVGIQLPLRSTRPTVYCRYQTLRLSPLRGHHQCPPNPHGPSTLPSKPLGQEEVCLPNFTCFFFFWLCQVHCCADFSLVAASRGSSSLPCESLSLRWVLHLQSTGFRALRL